MSGILRNRRVWFGVLLVAGLLTVAMWPGAVEVDVAQVTRGELLVTVNEEGETRVHDRFVVSAPVAGEVLRVELEPGDPVRKGQTVVATLRPAAPTLLDARTRAELTAAVDVMTAALGRARAERARAAINRTRADQRLERAEALLSDGLVASDEVDDRRAESRATQEALDAAEFAVATAQHDLDMARARLMRGTGQASDRPVEVRSPIDGVVLKRFHESQAVVPVGERLLELGDPSRLEIVSDLLSSEAVKVEAGDRVLIEQWGGSRPLNGRVRRVEPSGFMKVSALGVEEQRVNVIIDFEDPLDAWRALGDGFRVEVRIVTERHEEATTIPTGALFRRDDRWAVFVVENGRARLATIQVGAKNDREVQVAEGLSEGQALILYPPDTLADGARVVER